MNAGNPTLRYAILVSIVGRSKPRLRKLFAAAIAFLVFAIALIALQEIKLNISKNPLWGHWQGT
jgi:hypothetical protein